MYLIFIFLPFILTKLAELQLPLFGGTAKLKFQDFEKKIENGQKQIEGIVNTRESSMSLSSPAVYSLSSLLMTDQLKNSTYKEFFENRIEKSIVVGCQCYAEQQILCAIVAQLLQRQAISIFDSKDILIIPEYNFPDPASAFIALLRGDIDIIPSYTWMGFEMVLASSLPRIETELSHLNPGQSFDRLNAIYSNFRNPLQWHTYLGFYNNWELIMRKEDSEEKNISTLSDLNRFSMGNVLELGCDPYSYSRNNALVKLKSPQYYGISFKKVRFINRNEIYTALAKGDVDIIFGYSTDSEIRIPDYIRLEDDKNYFGKYYASLLSRKKLHERWPKITDTLNLLKCRFDEGKMADLINNAKRIKEKDTRLKTIEGFAASYFVDENIFSEIQTARDV